VRRARLFTLFALFALLMPASARAQTCFRARPGPDCRWTWLTESGARWLSSDPAGAARNHEFFWTVGMARTLGSESAAGFAVSFSTDHVESGTYRLAVQARYRRWLAPLLLDIGAGPILAGSGDAPVGLNGVSTHASLGYRSLVAIDAVFDAHRRNLTGRTTDTYLGFRLGGLPGVAFGVVTPIVLIIRALGTGPDVVAP
jgi:hypothetical protein